MKRQLLCIILVFSAAAFGAENTASAPSAAPDEPAWQTVKSYSPGEDYTSYAQREFFGSARNVQMLGDLLKDDDPLTREQAVRDLGQTHNAAAFERIRVCLKDADPNVRASAVTAGWELSQGEYRQIVLAGLADSDPRVVTAALRAIVRMKLASAGETIGPLLNGPSAAVGAEALLALDNLALPVDAGKLAALLKSPSVSVRLAAVMNASFADASKSGDLSAPLAEMAATDKPAIRGAAMAALGKLAFDANSAIIARGAGDSDPLVRRGALRAYANANKKADIKVFLDDASPLVRLAAIQSAGELKCEDCISKLFELMQSAPDDQAHMAARDSLRQIGSTTGGSTPIATQAGKVLRDTYTDMGPLGARRSQAGKAAGDQFARTDAIERELVNLRQSKNPDKKQIDEKAARVNQMRTDLVKLTDTYQGLQRQFEREVRNVRGACRLLGELRSGEEFDLRLSLVSKALTAGRADDFHIDSDILIETIYSLGRVGDKRSAGPLTELLKVSAKNVPAHFSDVPPPDAYYSTPVVDATIDALGELGAADSLGAMKAIMDARIKGIGRLNQETETIMRALPLIVSPANRSAIEGEFIDATINEGMLLCPVQFEAMKSAVRMKLNSPQTIKLLRDVLQVTRRDRNVMRCAAWALGQITGQAPAIGEPATYQGDWIVREE